MSGIFYRQEIYGQIPDGGEEEKQKRREGLVGIEKLISRNWCRGRNERILGWWSKKTKQIKTKDNDLIDAEKSKGKSPSTMERDMWLAWKPVQSLKTHTRMRTLLEKLDYESVFPVVVNIANSSKKKKKTKCTQLPIKKSYYDLFGTARATVTAWGLLFRNRCIMSLHNVSWQSVINAPRRLNVLFISQPGLQLMRDVIRRSGNKPPLQKRNFRIFFSHFCQQKLRIRLQKLYISHNLLWQSPNLWPSEECRSRIYVASKKNPRISCVNTVGHFNLF